MFVLISKFPNNDKANSGWRAIWNCRQREGKQEKKEANYSFFSLYIALLSYCVSRLYPCQITLSLDL